MGQSDKYSLAIESAISGGSIALFKGDSVTGESHGTASVSRAEDLLPSIDALLIASDVHKTSLKSIAISLGPGSYTGLRIGIATVMGLCKGLGIGHIGVDLFDAIAGHVDNNSAVIALPMGKADICLKVGSDSPRTISAANLADEIRSNGDAVIFAHSILVNPIAAMGLSPVDLGSNLAAYIGRAALNLPVTAELRPIYLRNPRFG